MHIISTIFDESYSFIRSRSQGKSAAYGITEVRHIGGEKIESKRILTRREYDNYLKFRDPTRNEVKVKRTCFMHNDTYFEVNEFMAPKKGLCFVSVQVEEGMMGEDVVSLFPEHLEVGKEVTNDEKYSTYYLSLKSDESSELKEKSAEA